MTCAALGSRSNVPARARRGPTRFQSGFRQGGLQSELDTVEQAHPTATVTFWAQDEHRLGLLPVARRVWAPAGSRPIAPVRRKYRWLSVYGLVRPATGQT